MPANRVTMLFKHFQNNVFDEMSKEVRLDVLNAPINERDLWKSPGKLYNNKSSVIDSIPSEFCKKMNILLIALYNRILKVLTEAIIQSHGAFALIH